MGPIGLLTIFDSPTRKSYVTRCRLRMGPEGEMIVRDDLHLLFEGKGVDIVREITVP